MLLFILVCAGSSLLHASVLSLVAESGSHSLAAVLGNLTTRLLVAERGLRALGLQELRRAGSGLQALALGLSSCDTWA